LLKTQTLKLVGVKMRKMLAVAVVLWVVTSAFAVEHKVSAIHGTISKIDADAKMLVVKTSDGVEHTLHLVSKTAVHGAGGAADMGKDSWRGLKTNSEVVAHYTEHGTEKTAVEIDKVGKDGLKSTEGTIKELDKGGKKVVVKTADGSEEAFRLTGNAAKDGGKDVAEAAAKGTKTTVYYTEEAGKKVAHFFE
jgi:hypothetical protein